MRISDKQEILFIICDLLIRLFILSNLYTQARCREGWGGGEMSGPRCAQGPGRLAAAVRQALKVARGRAAGPRAARLPVSPVWPVRFELPPKVHIPHPEDHQLTS